MLDRRRHRLAHPSQSISRPEGRKREGEQRSDSSGNRARQRKEKEGEREQRRKEDMEKKNGKEKREETMTGMKRNIVIMRTEGCSNQGGQDRQIQ